MTARKNALLDEATEYQRKIRANKRGLCSVGRFLADMPDRREAEEIQALMGNSEVWHSTLVQMLKRRGMPTTDKTVRRHRLGTAHYSTGGGVAVEPCGCAA